MARPVGLYGGDITGKGYLNQRQALVDRSTLVELLCAQPAPVMSSSPGRQEGLRDAVRERCDPGRVRVELAFHQVAGLSGRSIQPRPGRRRRGPGPGRAAGRPRPDYRPGAGLDDPAAGHLLRRPTLAARLGAGTVSGPMISQACATS